MTHALLLTRIKIKISYKDLEHTITLSDVRVEDGRFWLFSISFLFLFTSFFIFILELRTKS